MKIGEKDGKVCILEADLPITIDIEQIEQDGELYTINEIPRDRSIRILSESLEQMPPGSQLTAHCKGFVNCLKTVDDNELTKAWCKKIITLLIEENLLSKEDLL